MTTSNRRPFDARPGARASNERGGKLHTVITDHDAVQAFREMASKFGTLPERLCELANVDEKGNPGVGGVSPLGRMLAADLPNIERAAEEAAARLMGEDKPMTNDKGPDETAKPDAPPYPHDDHVHTGVFKVSEEAARDLLAALSGKRARAKSAAAEAIQGWPALAVGLGLGGPIRVALRAAAQAFAVALDDGATDDTGGVHDNDRTGFLRDRIVEDGGTGRGALAVMLGREPFVLLRALPTPGGVSLSVAVGGDGLDPEVGENLHAEVMLGNALDSFTQARRDAARRGDKLEDCLKFGTYLVPPGGEYRSFAPRPGAQRAHSTEDPYDNRSRPSTLDDCPPPRDTPTDSPPSEPPVSDDGGAPSDSGSSATGDAGPASD